MKRNKNICILINHHDDIKLFSKNLINKSDIYYKNFYVKLGLANSNLKIKELKFQNFLNKGNNFFFNFKTNWFKNKNNKNYIFFEKKFSIGNVSRDYVTRDLIIFLKNYYSYIELKKKRYDKIFISTKEIDCFKKFIDIKKKLFFYYNSNNKYSDFVDRDIETKFDYNLIKVKKYLFIFRFLQNLIKSLLSSKLLIFNDPSLKFFFKKKNFLVFNSVNIFKSFYFIRQKRVKVNFPNNFDFKFKQNLERFNLPQEFIDIFSEHINKKLRKNLNLFNTYYLMINEMLNFYKPKSIIIPSLKTFQSMLVQYACINKNINIILATDGSNMNIFNDIPFNKKTLKKNNVNIMTYSHEEKNFFKKIIDVKNIKLSPLPVHLNFKNNFKKKYDLVILDYFWSFNNNSIKSKRDYSYKILYDILSTVEKSKKKNIAIKFKKANSKTYFEYQEFVIKNILKKFSKLNINFLGDDFSEALNYSNIFVGGMSTSVIETIYSKKKYIIYLPSEVGFEDSFINKFSIYIKSKQVVRNLSELKKQINSKEKIKLKKKLNQFKLITLI